MYGDQSFFRGETPLTHTWGDREQRKSIRTSSQYGTVAVIGAVDPITGEHQELVVDWVDSESVNVFINHLSGKYKDNKILLILDNASYHKTQGKKPEYTVPENISIMFLPPYSPDLNPQENVWKIVKEAAFKNVLCKDSKELKDTVINAFNSFKDHKFIFTNN